MEKEEIEGAVQEPVDLSKLDEKIKEEPYDDETIKKRIRKTKIYAFVSIFVLVVLFFLIFLLRILAVTKTQDLSMLKMMHLFYGGFFLSVFIFIIVVTSIIILLKNYKKLSTYSKTSFTVRASIYVLIIIIIGAILYFDMSHGYSYSIEFDNTLIPTLQEISELINESLIYTYEANIHYFNTFSLVTKGDYTNIDQMLENLNKSRELYELTLNNFIQISNKTDLLVNNKKLSVLNIDKKLQPTKEMTEENIELINLRLSTINSLMMAIDAYKKGDQKKYSELIEEFNLKVEKEKRIPNNLIFQ